MQFIYSDPQTEFERLIGGYHQINAFGKIKAGDGEKFRIFLQTAGPPPRTPIYIDSIGGDVDAAMDIGRQIRAGWFETAIGQCLLGENEEGSFLVPRERLPGRCLSAATLMYLGGRLRHFSGDARFGVHQFSYKNPSPNDAQKSQALSAKIATYIAEMGVKTEFLEVSAAQSPEGIDYVDGALLRELNAVTDGVTSVAWSANARQGLLYVKGERDSIYGHHKVMLSYSKPMGFGFWAVIEAQGREDELTSFGLVEFVLDGEDTRIDLSDRCERGVYNSYVNILAPITQAEARAIAFSDSFGVQVRFSAEAEMFLGIAAMSTEGGRDELHTLYNTLCLDD